MLPIYNGRDEIKQSSKDKCFKALHWVAGIGKTVNGFLVKTSSSKFGNLDISAGSYLIS